MVSDRITGKVKCEMAAALILHDRIAEARHNERLDYRKILAIKHHNDAGAITALGHARKLCPRTLKSYLPGQ